MGRLVVVNLRLVAGDGVRLPLRVLLNAGDFGTSVFSMFSMPLCLVVLRAVVVRGIGRGLRFSFGFIMDDRHGERLPI